MVYVFLANGFEETEALVTVDLLRRAGLSVQTVGIGGKTVCGSHGISVSADVEDVDFVAKDTKAVVLPGGMPGTRHLEASHLVQDMLKLAVKENCFIAAICAAPSVLGHAGLLSGKRATCYPGFEPELIGATVVPDAAVRDGNIITGKGAGAVFDFSFAIIRALRGEEQATTVKEAIQCK